MVPLVGDSSFVDICAIKLIYAELSVRNVIDGSDKQIPISDFIEKCRAAPPFVTGQGVPDPLLWRVVITTS